MQLKFVKYYVLAFFLVFAILSFFLERIVVGVTFENLYQYEGIFDQIAGKIEFGFIFLGAYVSILFIVALAGFLRSRKRNKEISKGFLYSMVVGGVLILLFIALTIYAFVG
jgi:hypothetical protein